MEILENFPKIILAFATCGVKKYRPHHAVSSLQFSENLKKAIKKLNGNEQKKKKMKTIILWYKIITTTYETSSKSNLWKGSERFISANVYALKKSYNGKNSTVVFVDILRKNEKSVSSI